MAGHIDHGKTTLTKALTNVDTDRLKEEKEREISIEPGYAPLINNEDMQISIVDVPGHEKFIRQMIAGVAGIDFVILVVAADEGVMPQTKEHIEILSFLGIEKGIVAITKIDRVDPEVVEFAKQEILLELDGTIFDGAECVYIDSLSKKGVEELKSVILTEVQNLQKKNRLGDFRLPIDQVFSIQGQGTIARGTVFEGQVSLGSEVYILPKNLKSTVRNLQVHHQPVEEARAGQRAAINVAGIPRDQVKRGDVIVVNASLSSTQTIDVSLRFVKKLAHPVKQRMMVNCHIGTSEVRGTLVFFDRNEVMIEEDQVLCQIRLEEPIVAKRGDRLILRRPSPSETIAGGWVIDANGKKYKFGQDTIKSLKEKIEGTLEDRIKTILLEKKSITLDDLSLSIQTGMDEIKKAVTDSEELFVIKSQHITHKEILDETSKRISLELENYHESFPMRNGMNKAEIMEEIGKAFTKEVVEEALGSFTKEGPYIKLYDFKPHVPKQWQKRTETMLEMVELDGLQVKLTEEYIKAAGIPESFAEEILSFLEFEGSVLRLTYKIMWTRSQFEEAVQKCRRQSSKQISIQDVKEALQLTRKYMIPFLEKLDALGLTKRNGESRIWVDEG